MLKTPESILSGYQEQAKFNFVWRINIVFTIIGFLMTIYTYQISDRFYLFYAIVFFITSFSIISLNYFKVYRTVAIILYFSITIILGYAIFSVPESLHLQESIWMIVVILAAFFTLGNTWGYIYLLVNTVFYFIYYNYAFAGTAHISLTIRPEALFLLSVEFAISMFLVGYVMFQYGLINKYAYKNASEAYEELRSEKQIVEHQNREKSVLLQEIHHRVKNNLQVIVSLLRLQSRELQSQEAKASFEDAINRVLAMSLIHQKLYENKSLMNVDLQDYLSTLIRNIISTNNIDKHIDFNVHSNFLNIGVKNIVPIGLIVNELVSNSMKHAFDNSGEIKLVLEPMDGNDFKMTYSDNGLWKDNPEKTFGTQLIEIFTEQLDGKFKREIKGSGTYYYFELKEDKEKSDFVTLSKV